jgi:putative oxidoreductase
LKWLLVSNDVAAYGGIFAIAPAFFAFDGCFAEAVWIVLLCGFQTELLLFWLFAPCYIFMQQYKTDYGIVLQPWIFFWVMMFFSHLRVQDVLE